MAARKETSNKDMNGLKITNLGAGSAESNDAVRMVQMEAGDTAAKSRANHTGTQTASTISDFDAQVRTSRLDQMAAPTGPVGMGSQKITGMADGTAATDGATKGQLDAAIASLTSGMTPKGSVRVASTVNVTISAPGAAIDGVAMSAGETFLATAQTTGSEEGPYVWNGAAVPATRAGNWDTAGEATLASYWVVREGTKADQLALVTNDAAITPGTTDLTWTFFNPAGGGTTAFTQDVPAISAGGSATITHGLGTRDVSVTVYRNGSPWDDVDVYVDRPSANTVTLQPDIAFSNAEYRVKVSKS